MTSFGERPIAPGLDTGLRVILEAVRVAENPWWIIGSAAMALHGASPLVVADIDLLMSRSDALRLLGNHGVEPSSAPLAPFRSDVFGRFAAGPMTVDVMGGFHVQVGADWHEVLPETREPVTFAGGILYVPAVTELISMCDLFGRPKDLDRRRLLEPLLAVDQ